MPCIHCIKKDWVINSISFPGMEVESEKNYHSIKISKSRKEKKFPDKKDRKTKKKIFKNQTRKMIGVEEIE